MNTQNLIHQFQSLPKDLQKQVEEFIQSLLAKTQKETDNSDKQNPPVYRKAGTMEGLVLYMSDDFDKPLEDFSEYM